MGVYTDGEIAPTWPSFPSIKPIADAVAMSRRYKLSYWDGAILAAARAAGCDVVYSEDLSEVQNYDGLRVIDPFR